MADFYGFTEFPETWESGSATSRLPAMMVPL